MKKHLTPFRVVAGCLALLVFTFGGVVAAGWLLPPPAIVVSKETTYITEPLRPDGLVDYREAYRQMYFADLTPENNAIFDYAQTFDPAKQWRTQEAKRKAFMKALGLTRENAPTFVDLKSFGKAHPELMNATLKAQGLPLVVSPEDEDGAENEFWDEQYDTEYRNDRLLEDWLFELQEYPWTREEFPVVAAWIEAQSDLLEHMARGSRKPGFFFPDVNLEDEQSFLSYILYDHYFSRRPVRLLGCRAMLKVGEGDDAGAWEDYLIASRMARQFGRSRVATEWLTGVALRNMAGMYMAYYFHHAGLSESQLRQLRTEWEGLPQFLGTDGLFAYGERFIFLDMLQERPNEDIVHILPDRDQPVRAIDWNVVMRRYNDEIDAVVKLQAGLNTRERIVEIDRWFDSLAERNQNCDTWRGRTASFISRGARSEQLALQILNELTGTSDAILKSELRSNHVEKYVHLAIILAQYRAAHGEYPESLDALVPEFLAELPADPFAADGRIGYQRCDDGGYHLYSPGFNGKDDGGSSPDYHQDYSEIDDDIVLRVPVQEAPEEEL